MALPSEDTDPSREPAAVFFVVVLDVIAAVAADCNESKRNAATSTSTGTRRGEERFLGGVSTRIWTLSSG